jgi:hypothetical protein
VSQQVGRWRLTAVIAIASSALLLIVGGITAPHVRRLLAGEQ